MNSAPKSPPDALSEYERKRRFDATPEPSGADAGPAGAGTDRFVVHEHHARRLHWDLRLERDGVLVSWAVPNAIPQDPRHNRKAVHVEDHPLDYIDFQGTIPAGNYGAGEVTVWDRGTYETEKWTPEKVTVVFHGQRLQGRYALFQAGKTEKDWMIHRMDPPVDPGAGEIPEFIAPMLARHGKLPAADESAWGFEISWDGVRALARTEPGRLALLDVDGEDVTATFPELRALNRALGAHSAMLDGEIVVFGVDGRPSPAALAERLAQNGDTAIRRHAESTPATYIVCDLLWLDGHSRLEQPYSERRASLEALDLTAERWQTPAFHRGDGAAVLRASGALGLPGIVAKRLDSAYVPGGREWIEISSRG